MVRVVLGQPVAKVAQHAKGGELLLADGDAAAGVALVDDGTVLVGHRVTFTFPEVAEGETTGFTDLVLDSRGRLIGRPS